MANFTELNEMVESGKRKVVKELVAQMIEEGVTAKEILEQGLMPAMSVVGEKFKNNEVFVPEVLVAARAMNEGITLLRPLMKEADIKAPGTCVIGTVKGDLHDIGKNLVKMMLESKGINVIDLGVDVTAEQMVASAKENHADIICCSALLTTTMVEMERVVSLVKEEGLQDKVMVMIGGAPVTEEFCKKIGADCYTPDAASAADAALAYLQK